MGGIRQDLQKDCKLLTKKKGFGAKKVIESTASGGKKFIQSYEIIL